MLRVVPLGSAALDAEALALAAAALARGELVIFPTDTLYALGCRALDAAAAERVRRVKGRDESRPLPLVLAELGQLRGVCPKPPRALEPLAERFWPGPLTLVVPAAAAVPEAVTSGSGTVAVRVPALDFARRLCARAGPLVSTSANRTGRPAPSTCEAAVREVGGSAAVAVDGGEGGSAPSTVVDLTGAAPRLLRAGALPWADVEAVLRDVAP
ncbi:MAG TPA: L-threonylcarbamoyladenylate synthase [Vicinamibacteria bacterium]|nr:L-threonylcarbamoyladenylate synthase [Vicinamibacteria bacterium]